MNRREELLRLVCAVESDVSLDARVWTPDDVVERATELLSEIDKRAPVERPSKLRELLADTTSADDGATLSAEDMVAFASEPVSAPVEDEDGPDVIRDASGVAVRMVSAGANRSGEPVVEDGHDYWFPFLDRDNKVTAAKLQAYWHANYRFAVDETFDEESGRVVKLPANQGRTPEGDVVTFEWYGLLPNIKYPDGTSATLHRFDLPVSKPLEQLHDRLCKWALSNVPEEVEIVDGVPRYREAEKEPEAFFVEFREGPNVGRRWDFVETPQGWVCATKGVAFHVLEATGSDVTNALRAYLDAKGITWRKDGGA